jgi:hypothetical protein
MAGTAVLAIVLDVNPYTWGARKARGGDLLLFSDLVADVLLFINAFMLLNPENQLVVIASHLQCRFASVACCILRATRVESYVCCRCPDSTVLYPPPDPDPDQPAPDAASEAAPLSQPAVDSAAHSAASAGPAASPEPRGVAGIIRSGLIRLTELEPSAGGEAGPSVMADALTRALCHINRPGPPRAIQRS